MFTTAMRLRLFILSATILTFGITIFGQTHSDFNKEFRFAQLHTWNFVNANVHTNDTVGKNPIWDANLRQYLSSELQKNGFSQSTENPDFMLRYHLGTQEKTRIEVFPEDFPGFMYHRGSWLYWRGSWANTIYRIPYNEATLVVDLVDSRSNELVWRGYDRRTIDLDRSDKTLKKAAEKLIGRFAKDVRKNIKSTGKL
jgi:hypothetical protein